MAGKGNRKVGSAGAVPQSDFERTVAANQAAVDALRAGRSAAPAARTSPAISQPEPLSDFEQAMARNAAATANVSFNRGAMERNAQRKRDILRKAGITAPNIGVNDSPAKIKRAREIYNKEVAAALKAAGFKPEPIR